MFIRDLCSGSVCNDTRVKSRYGDKICSTRTLYHQDKIQDKQTNLQSNIEHVLFTLHVTNFQSLLWIYCSSPSKPLLSYFPLEISNLFVTSLFVNFTETFDNVLYFFPSTFVGQSSSLNENVRSSRF